MLDQIRAFVAVAKHLGLRQASDELHITPTAISKRLKALQEELGVKLYKPSAKGIELTATGRVALVKMLAIIQQAEEMKESLRRAAPKEQQAEEFSVAGAFSLGAEFLPALIELFEKLHAGVQVNCHTGSSAQIEQMIRQGRAAISLSNYAPLGADIGAEPFRVQALVFFVNSRHPLATRRRIALSDVLACPLVIRGRMGGASWAHDFLKQLSERGFKSKIALECNGPLRVKESVGKNLGVGISYLDNLKAEVASGRFVVLKGADLQFPTLSYILHCKKRGLSAAAHEFLRLLRRAKNVPQGEDLDRIPTVSKKRGLNPASQSRRLG